MVGIRCRPEGLPFRDGAFGVVLCLDVLERVRATDRAGFVRRGSAGSPPERVILACPSSEAQNIDDLLVTTFQTAGTPPPPWLTEHYKCSCRHRPRSPRPAPPSKGFRATPLAMPNGLLTTATTLAELSGPARGRQPATRRHALRDAWVALYRSACFGESARKGWVLERVVPRVPLAGHDDLEATALGALRCPECDGAVEGSRAPTCCAAAHAICRWRAMSRAPGISRVLRRSSARPRGARRVERLLRRFVEQRRGPASLVLYAPPEVIDGSAALRAAQAAFGDALGARSPRHRDPRSRATAGEFSALQASRTVLVA